MDFVKLSRGPVIAESQGPFSPDELVGDAYSRRFTGRFTDGRYLFITDYYAAYDIRATFHRDDSDTDGRPYDVENVTEFRITSDPDGDNELFSDYTSYDYPNYQSFATVEEADKSARQYANVTQEAYFSVPDTEGYTPKI